MNKTDIIIIGAGAAGLMAARTLAIAGKKVIVLEARERCGGRIHTLNNQSFFQHAELGAEFIHGDLPVTIGLLKQAGIPYKPTSDEMWRHENGKFSNNSFFNDDWDLLMDKLNQLNEDVDIVSFLEKEFAGEKYLSLRESVWNFVSGYDTADPRKISALALRKEWLGEGNGAQYRIDGGYHRLIKYLEIKFNKFDGHINLNSIVKEIHWQQGKVNLLTEDGVEYEAPQVLIAMPLGVLQAGEDEKGAITFYPPLEEQRKAIKAMGFGAVIKILLEFDELFWEDEFTTELAGSTLTNMTYLLSDEEIPTWWTQSPWKTPVLTGWIGGPGAEDRKGLQEEQILQQALESLAKIFNRDPTDLKDKLVAFNVVNWTAEPFTLGSYAYDTVEAPEARKLLNSPVKNTLFFAGEYLYDGPAMGTVEAALTSGMDAAKAIINAIDINQ